MDVGVGAGCVRRSGRGASHKMAAVRQHGRGGEEQMNNNVQRVRVRRRSRGGQGRLHGSTVRLGYSYGSKLSCRRT